MSYNSNSPAIFMLPNEVLVRIFQHCVSEDHSPIPLSHVCQLWRELAFATSSLWNIIYLDSRFIQRARHHLSLARKQPLTIISSEIDTEWSRPLLREYEQVLASAAGTSLLTHLNLNLHASILSPILTRLKLSISQPLPQPLLQLQNLTLNGQNFWDLSCYFGNMPRLCHLSLSDLGVNCQDFADALSGCHLLEILTLSNVGIIKYGREPDIVELPHLKSITMNSLLSEYQGCLMSFIVPPSHCTLRIISRRNTVSSSHPILHPTTVAMLQPIRFMTVHLRAASVVYAEIPRGSRCTFQLEISTIGNVRAPWNALKLHDSDTAFVTLDIDSDALETLGNTQALLLLAKMLPFIHALIIRPRTLQALATRNGQRVVKLLAMASHLETLVLEGLNLDASAEAGLENVEGVRTLVRQMQSVKNLRAVLQGCETSQEGLNMLREVLPVDRL